MILLELMEPRPDLVWLDGLAEQLEELAKWFIESGDLETARVLRSWKRQAGQLRETLAGAS